MGSYIATSVQEREEMLASVGVGSLDELFADIPSEVRKKGEWDLPPGRSEMEVLAYMERLASQNQVFRSVFRGAGAYDHYIPQIVKSVVSKEEFLTTYTPYQAEVSQGVLQSIFEYQTMVCRLTGMDASNASVYDGASAAAEAAAMCRDRKRNQVLVSAAAHPDTIRTIRTYCFGNGMEFLLVPEKDGVTDTEFAASHSNGQTACLYVQQPNYYGLIEDADSLGMAVHQAGGKYIMGINPIAAAILKTPRECGADIAVGDGQPLGMPLGYGGPYLGFMACTADLTRKLPGRIAGETVDAKGRRGYVLTLQAREQHIRREKASSNICSNQALCAMTMAVYMAAMGAEGMAQAASLCASKAAYLRNGLKEAGFLPVYGSRPFFHEFVTTSPVPAGEVEKQLEKAGILGGLPLAEDRILWCCTEKNSREDMDELTGLLKKMTERGGGL